MVASSWRYGGCQSHRHSSYHRQRSHQHRRGHSKCELRVIVNLHRFQSIKTRRSMVVISRHCLATKLRTLNRVIELCEAADVNRKPSNDDRHSSFHHSMEPVSSPQVPHASINIPLHIPEPLSMTRAAISSSSDMVRVVLVLLKKVSFGLQHDDYYEKSMTASILEPWMLPGSI